MSENVNKKLAMVTTLAMTLITLGAGSSSVLAATGYTNNSAGSIVLTRSGCLHTPRWTPEVAIEECDPQFIAKADVAVAAVIVERPITLAADAHFGFDKTILTDEGKAKLDELAGVLGREIKDQNIEVIGYADRIGPADYNLGLSERRAQVVKDYLVGKGLPASSIVMSGKGSANPIVGCDGMRGAALVDCLAPNRRTEIDFSAVEIIETTTEVTP